jgi:hypothetical protein
MTAGDSPGPEGGQDAETCGGELASGVVRPTRTPLRKAERRLRLPDGVTVETLLDRDGS